MPSKQLARAVIAIIFVIVVSQLSSCGGPARPPQTDVAGYTALRMKLGDRDFRPLADRLILIDPGHGGFFRGAVGLGGITEAEVNLGVALHLRGLLEWAGAEAYLTRTADYDFLSPADSNLAADLRARVAMSDSLQPDVFLSIHHNSNASLDRTLNETQTYYPVGRDGADLDLARSVHKHLVQVLGISPAKILPGNFHVLRNNSAVAVLGEPAMLSNPVIEQRLSLAAKQELEAQAYFLGLLEYFAGGVPEFSSTRGDTLRAWQYRHDHIIWRFDPGGLPGLDPNSVELRVDGEKHLVTIAEDGLSVVWPVPPALETGRHVLRLRGRNLAGRSTPVNEVVLKGDNVGGHFRAKLIAEPPDGNTAALLTWEWIDANGHDTPGPGPLSMSDNGFDNEGRRLPVFEGRHGWLLLSSDELPTPLFFGWRQLSDVFANMEVPNPRGRQMFSGWSWLVLLNGHREPYPPPPGGSWRLRLPDPLAPLEHRSGGASYRLPPYLDTRAPVVAIADSLPYWIEADGAHPIFGDENHLPPWSLPGATPADTLYWEPLLPDLVGRVVIIDPAGGGRDTQGIAPLGTRGAALNQRVAEMLAVLLRGAGCEVHLTREDERWIEPEAKVLLANEVGANLFLTIGRSAAADIRWGATYCHGSGRGEQWAGEVADALRPLTDASLDSTFVRPGWDYLLRHTACPALHVALPHAATIEEEERLTNPSWQQSVARALMLGTARLLSPDVSVLHPDELLAAAGSDMPSVADIRWVQFDGNFPWLPPTWSDARPRTPGLPVLGDRGLMEVRTDTDNQLWAFRHEAGDLTDLRLVHKYIGDNPDVR